MPARLATLLVAAAVAEAVLWDGGYDPGSRIAFCLLAFGAALLAWVAQGRDARRVLAGPPVLALVVLGGAGLASVLWTEGDRGDSVRWGLVTLGYAAVLVSVATAVDAGTLTPARIAGGIAVLAGLSGTIGLVAAALHATPYADRIGGAWRPGGTLQYPPALALLQVAALPALVAGLRSGRPPARAAAAVGALVAVAVLLLAGSRLELALGVGVVVWVVRRTGRPVRIVRGGTAGAVGDRSRWHRALAVGGVLAVVVVALLVSPAGSGSGRRDGGVTHGRIELWQAGVRAAQDHLVHGSGADTFVVASARYQRSGPVLFAHDLPLELAVELGLGGLLLAFWLYGATAVVLRRAEDTAVTLLGPAVLTFLLAGLVDWPWHLAGSGAVFAAALGGLWGTAANPSVQNKLESDQVEHRSVLSRATVPRHDAHGRSPEGHRP